MVCAACGAPVVDGVRFCARCGAGVAPASGQVYAGQPVPVAGHYAVPYSPQPRVQPRLQTLGTFWCVYALYRVVAAAIGMIVLRAFTLGSFGGAGWPFHHLYDGHNGWGQHGPGSGGWDWLLQVIAVAVVISVALSAFTGWSLLQRKPWGRTLSIVTAILALLKFPFGTALGIYTLWVMVPSESGMEWEAIADRS